MLADHVALLEQAWRRRQRSAFGQRAAWAKIHGLPIAPRATVTPSTPVSRIMAMQACGVNRSPLPSTVRWPGVPLHFAQKLPAAGADVALLDGAAVNGDRRDAARERAVEDRKELVAAFGRVVDAAAHLDRDGHVRRHGVADASDDFERHFRLAEVIPAAAAAQHLFHRAAEVDVDDVEAGFDQPRGRRSKILGFAPISCPPTGCSSSVTRMRPRFFLVCPSCMTNWSSITSQSV